MNLDFLKNKFTRKLAAEFFRLRKGIPRSWLALRYLRGSGLEIGALHNPVYVPFGKVRYVDRMSLSDLLLQYPELKNLKVVAPEFIDDGEKLSTVPPQSQDFIIANHFIEHCEDPIRTIKNFSDKLQTGGVLYMAVPDRLRTFDRRRAATTFAHLARDFREGSLVSQDEHFYDFAKNVNLPVGATEAAVQDNINVMKDKNYSIHYHVWTGEEFGEFLKQMFREFNVPMEFLDMKSVADENIFVVRKI
jgi:SAM-dependent methyltransferase